MTPRLDVRRDGVILATESDRMEHLVLPRLAGTREAVYDLLSEQDVPKELVGQTLTVHARDLASGSPSFADQLVKVVLQERQAEELIILGAPQRFIGHVLGSAERRGVRPRVSTTVRPRVSRTAEAAAGV